MGNPSINLENTNAPAGPMQPAANGILAYLDGPSVATGSKQLPTPQPGQPAEMVATVMSNRGLVRITYRLNSYKHRRSTHWHWVAVRADLAS